MSQKRRAKIYNIDAIRCTQLKLQKVHKEIDLFLKRLDCFNGQIEFRLLLPFYYAFYLISSTIKDNTTTDDKAIKWNCF